MNRHTVFTPRIVKVGDHDPEPVVRIHPRRAAELHAIRAASWSEDEYLGLRNRLADAALHFKRAIDLQDFAGIRSAAIDFDEIAEQLQEMNKGLFSAIEKVAKHAAEFAAQDKEHNR